MASLGRLGIRIKCDYARVRELLEQLPDNLIKKSVKKAAKKNWEIVQKEAISRVPVDTGRLKETILIKSGYSKRQGTIFATVGLQKITKKARQRIRARKAAARDAGKVLKGNGIEYDAYYGVFVEFGAPGQPGPQPAEPYMRPAFDEKSQKALGGFNKDVEAGLEAEFKNLNKAPRVKE